MGVVSKTAKIKNMKVQGIVKSVSPIETAKSSSKYIKIGIKDKKISTSLTHVYVFDNDSTFEDLKFKRHIMMGEYIKFRHLKIKRRWRSIFYNCTTSTTVSLGGTKISGSKVSKSKTGISKAKKSKAKKAKAKRPKISTPKISTYFKTTTSKTSTSSRSEIKGPKKLNLSYIGTEAMNLEEVTFVRSWNRYTPVLHDEEL